MNRSVIERFESKFVQAGADECWPWLAGKFSDGYGQFKFDGKPISAHRMSYLLYVGEIPDEMCVCHKCDNKPCVNPSHFFLGTVLDNIHDRDAKGRGRFAGKGEAHPMAKLTNEDILLIRENKGTGADIARFYGVKPSVICNIRKMKTWRHVA